MATELGFHKVTALPQTAAADSIYFVGDTGDATAQLYVTDSNGAVAEIATDAVITAIAQGLITSAMSAQNSVEVFATIALRDAATLTRNSLVVVTDASADPTVTSGSAMYIYEVGPDTFGKLTEFESLDVTLNWSGIVGRPTSSPALIDDAVAKRHTHANKPVLDTLGENAQGQLTKGGAVIGSHWTTAAW